MRYGLALSGGALRGAAHIGVLKALCESNLFPSWISGTSAGSIVAALYACGYTPRQIEDIACSLGKEIFDTDYVGIASAGLRWMLTRRLTLSGFVKGNRLEMLMHELTKGRTMREAKVPLAILAVNINNGQSVVFVSNKKGMEDTKYKTILEDVPIYRAVRASISIPIIFQPLMIQGLRLVDGGVNDNLPIAALELMGAKAAIGINLGYSGQRRDEVDNLLEIGNQTIDIMAYQITRLKSKGAELILNPEIFDIGMTEMSKIPYCIRRGYEMTMANMDLIKKAINS